MTMVSRCFQFGHVQNISSCTRCIAVNAAAAASLRPSLCRFTKCQLQLAVGNSRLSLRSRSFHSHGGSSKRKMFGQVWLRGVVCGTVLAGAAVLMPQISQSETKQCNNVLEGSEVESQEAKPRMVEVQPACDNKSSLERAIIESRDIIQRVKVDLSSSRSCINHQVKVLKID